MSIGKGFFRNTAIMFVSMLIVKFLGAVFKIPLGNILGGEGMGYFTTAFSIYTPVLAFTCSGVPAIITQVIAQKLSKGELDDIIHYRRSALFLGAVSGITGTAVIYIAAVPFTDFLVGSPESLMSVMIIAPSVLFCSIAAVYRGYYEGISDMLPTAISQIIEAVTKSAVGLVLSHIVYVFYVHKFGNEEQALPYAAAAAVLGVTAGELFGLIYIFFRSRKKDFSYNRNALSSRKGDIIRTAGEIFMQSLPVAIGAVISNLISFTDLVTISNCLNLSFHYFPNQLVGGAVSLSQINEISDVGNFLYGSYSGMVISVYMLTATLPVLIARCSFSRLVCTIELNKNDNTAAIKKDISVILKGTMLISAPISLFMAVFAEPVLNILFPVREIEAAVGVIPLQVLSIGGIFSSFGSALLIVFQAYGDFKTPVKATLFGGFFKFLLNILLLMIPGINITGAAAATAISNGITVLFILKRIRKQYSIKLFVPGIAFPSLISASIGAITSYYAYNSVISEFHPLISLILSCIIGALLYFLILFIADSRELLEIIRSIRNKNAQKSCKFSKNVVK